MKEKLTEIWLWMVAVTFTLAAIAALFAWIGMLVLFFVRIME